MTGVRTSQGEYEADIVVVCTGVKPNTEFLADTGIERLGNGAIKVDRQGRSSLANVWSVGDCASVWHAVKQQQVYVPLATIANKLGRMVGENLAGAEQEFPGTLGSAALKVLGLEAGRTGLSEQEAKAMGIDYRTVVIRTSATPTTAQVSPTFTSSWYTRRAASGCWAARSSVARGGPPHRCAGGCHHHGVTTEQLGMLDFAYAPPFSRTWDVLNVAGNVAK